MANILIVDDSATSRQHLSALLEGAGHHALQARDGAEGLERARLEHPDLIIADIVMPNMDGYEFVRQLRADNPIAHTPVIFCTAHFHEREAQSLACACGVSTVLDKPGEPEEFLRTVDRALGQPATASSVAFPQEFDREHLRLLTDKLSKDVNALTVANEALSQSEVRFRGLVEGSMQGIMIRSGEQIQYANPACALIFGFSSPVEMIGLPWYTVVAPEELPTHRARAAACLRGEALPPLPGWQGVRKDGARIWLESNARSFVWDGKPAILAFVTDITERKKTEETLRQSELRFRSVVEGSIQGIAVHSGSIIQYVNPAVINMFGYDSADEILGQPWHQFVAPEELPNLEARAQACLRGESVAPHPGWQGIRKDGTRIWVQSSASPFTWSGQPAVLSIMVDITERKQAEETLRQSELRFRSVVESSMQGIMVRSGELIQYANPAMAQIFGCDNPSEMVGQPWHRFAAPEEISILRERAGACLRGETVAPHPGWQGIRKDGTRIWLESTAQPFTWDGKPALLALLTDITQRKLAEAALGERVRLASLVGDIGASLTRESELRSMLHLCADALVRHLGAAFARIWTLDENLQELQMQASAGMYTRLDGPHGRILVGAGKCKIGQIASERQPHLTNTMLGDPRVGDQEWVKREGMVAFAGYPLIVDHTLIGVMAIYARHPLSETTISAMAAVADEIALGIERKKADEALRREKELFRSAFEHTNVAMVLTDLTHRFMRANSAFAEFFGYSMAEMLQLSMPDVTHPDDLAESYAGRERLLRGESPFFQMEKRYRHKDGHILWGLTTVSLVRDASGQPAHYIGQVQDITQRKRAEEALGERDALYRLLTDNSNDLIYLLEVSGILVYASPSIGRLGGIDVKSAIGTSAFAKIHADDLPAAQAAWSRVLAGENVSITLRLQNAAGFWNWIEFLLSLVQYQGRPHVMAVGRDLTERKQAEGIRTRLGAILDATPDLVAITHMDGPASYINPAGRRMLGVGESEQVFISHFRPPDMLAFILDEAIPTAIREGCWQGETYFQTRSGERITVSQVLLIHKDSHGEVDFISIIARDITESKRADEQLRLFRALIDKSNDTIEVVDPVTGRFLDVNEKACLVHGYTREEYLALTVADIDPIVAGQKWPEIVEKVRQTGFTVFENQHKRKDGSVFPVEVHVNYVRLDREYMLAVVRDITDSRRVERRIATEHAVTRVLATSPTLTEAGAMILQTVCETLGWDLGELWDVDARVQLLHCTHIWHTPSLQAEEFVRASKQITLAPGVGLPGRVWASREPHWIADVVQDANFPRLPFAAKVGLHGGFAFPILFDNRVLGVIEFFSQEVKRPDEDVLHMVAAIGSQIGQYIERKRAEESLRANEERTRLILDSANDSFVRIDTDGRILDWNRQAEIVFGWSRAEVAGRPLVEVIIPAQFQQAHKHGLQRFRETGEGPILNKLIEITACRRDGSEFPVELVVWPIHFDGQCSVSAFIRDVTARKRADEELRSAQQRLQHVVTSSPAVLFTLAIENEQIRGISWMGDNVLDMLGYAVNDTLGADWWMGGVHPNDIQSTIDTVNRDLFGKGFVAHEYRFRHRDGNFRWVRGEIRLLRDDAGRPIEAIGSWSDITDFKRTQDERARLAAIVETTTDLVGIADPSGKVLYANRAGRRLLGVADDATMGTIGDYHPAWAMEIIVNTGIPTAIRDGSWTGETAILSRDGREIPCSQVLMVHKDAAGAVDYMATIIRDIAERKRSEDALRGAQQRLQHVVSSNPAVLYTMTPSVDSFVLTWASDNLRDLLGYSLEEALVPGFWEAHVHPEDREWVSSKVQQHLVEHGHVTSEYRFRHRDGNYRWFRSEKRLLSDESGQQLEVVGSWSDITDRRQLEDQFRQAQKMEAIGKLAGGVAHDFNNLLTVIMGYSDVVFDRLREGDPLRPFIDEVRKSGTRAASLTRQLLAFSRKQILVPEVVDLNALLNEMERMLTRLIGEDIDLKFAADSSLGKVKVDRGQMEQVIMNLVVNARDAMPQGGKLTIETANIELDDAYTRVHPYTQPGPYVLVSVSDTGCGMDEATRLRIFEPFFTTKGPEKGTGLGLSTVYGIVKQSNGFIEVYSEPDKGSTFKIYLPRVGEEIPKKKTRSMELSPRRGAETVLLVEDEPGVRTLARLVLEKDGYTVIEAQNGCDALLYSQKQAGTIHIMVTDVVMPDMSGPQLAKQLMALRPDMKVLFLSGYTDDAIVRHGFIDGDVPFLQKPFTKDGFLKKVREVLEQQ